MIKVLRVGAMLAASTAYAVTVDAEPARYDVGPALAWVLNAPTGSDSAPASAGASSDSGGTEYLLSDTQVRVDAGWSEYGHFILRVTNPSGVSDNSNINISFDPELDHLTVHSVTLRRAGETIDELAKGRVEVLQRESGLENGILDGRQTFHVLMSDVRAGDAIDYSYTIEHHEPLWGNRYFGRYLTQWEEPVRRSRLRFVLRANAPIFIKHPPQAQPVKTDDGTWQNLEWDWHDVAGLPTVKEAPVWYEQYPAIQLTQFASWKELVDASLPMYSRPGPTEPELAAFEKQLTSSAHSAAARALAVIRFVQEEVRYTGLELGSGAYRPTPPVEVFRRRYGDCKDKVLLAVTMLRDLGIDAVPALVSTRWDNHLHERLPSPGDFDHVIARIRIDSKLYWIDLTSTGQEGDLPERVQADFGEALVVAPGTSAPEAMPRVRPKYPLVAANAELDLRAGYDKEATFTVATVYRGERADGMRRQLRRSTTEELGTNYLNFYKKRYSGIRAVGAPQVTDDTRRNELTVNESYRIEHVFETRSSGEKHFSVDAEIIDEHLGKIGTPARKIPLGLEYPVDTTERIRVRLPDRFPVKDDVVKFATAYFQYDSRVSHSGNDVLLEYHYQTLTDLVPVEALQEFLAKRSDAYQDTEFGFTLPADEAADKKQLADALEMLQHAGKLAQANQEAKADEVLKTLLASDGFRTLDAEQQHVAVYFAAAVALDQGDSDRALELARRATDMKAATADDWSLRLSAAFRTGHKDEAASSLTTLAERWPQRLNDLDFRVIGRSVVDAPKTGPIRQQLLTALFSSNFTPEDRDTSHWWRDLALLQLQDGDPGAARKTFARVKDPYMLVAALADNRLEPVRNAIDIPTAIDRQIRDAREAVAARTHKLLPVVRLTGLLIESLHYAEALQVADDAIKMMGGPTGAKVYDDYRTYRVWLLDERARALCGLGRWDEAVAQLMSARLQPEGGSANVSQTINLASLYNDMGKPKEANQTLAELSAENASVYGSMQVAIERLASADQLGDAAEVEKQLAFLREHRDDSQATYQRGLISANRQEDAAKLLISRLQDPDLRMEALMEVQKFTQPPLPKRAEQWRKRWRAMVARPDVIEAIRKVGVVSEYPLVPQAY